MKRKSYLLFILSFLAGNSLFGAVAAPSSQPMSEHQEQEDAQLANWVKEAVQAGNEYVSMLDQGQYADSWRAGSSIFQHTISQQEWTLTLELARNRLGRAISRTIKDVRIAWDVKGLPKGPYMVVEYNTNFEKAPNLGETLTFIQGPDGKWKVLTYVVN